MKFAIALFLFFSLANTAQAIGVSVSPPKIEIIYPDSADAHLNIKNISLEPVLVTASPDDFARNISISPDEFQLLPAASRRLTIRSDFSNDKSGIKKTDISIVTRALDQKSFNAASGLKIPLTININQNPFWQWSGSVVFIITFFGLLLLVLAMELTNKLIRPSRRPVGFNIDLSRHHKRWWHFWH